MGGEEYVVEPARALYLFLHVKIAHFRLLLFQNLYLLETLDKVSIFTNVLRIAPMSSSTRFPWLLAHGVRAFTLDITS